MTTRLELFVFIATPSTSTRRHRNNGTPGGGMILYVLPSKQMAGTVSRHAGSKFSVIGDRSRPPRSWRITAIEVERVKNRRHPRKGYPRIHKYIRGIYQQFFRRQLCEPRHGWCASKQSLLTYTISFLLHSLQAVEKADTKKRNRKSV